uniref:Uncharacterized protein n=1 Tax=Physcomitrium patens TaxID=3218 RepID=A0A2K1KI03_PHYPA|nr:hypothetical protein PHYPA_007089 [Physcomitrium patens]
MIQEHLHSLISKQHTRAWRRRRRRSESQVLRPRTNLLLLDLPNSYQLRKPHWVSMPDCSHISHDLWHKVLFFCKTIKFSCITFGAPNVYIWGECSTANTSIAKDKHYKQPSLADHAKHTSHQHQQSYS